MKTVKNLRLNHRTETDWEIEIGWCIKEILLDHSRSEDSRSGSIIDPCSIKALIGKELQAAGDNGSDGFCNSRLVNGDVGVARFK